MKDLIDLAGKRLKFQRNYEPKLRALVETRSSQLGFTESEREKALKSMDALVWKLTAAGIHLERLWENREVFDRQQLISRILTDHSNHRRFTDEEVAFLTAEFEAFLFQARALISVAQVHTLDACRVQFGGQLTNEKYTRKVHSAPEQVKPRLTKAHKYFTEKIFGSGKWGSLLKSLRDRIAHFDRIRPSQINLYDGSEDLTVTGLSLERLAQDFENGVYDLLVEVIAPIWERKWVPGAYYQNMWT